MRPLYLNTSNPDKLAEFRRLGLSDIQAMGRDLPEPDADPLTVIRSKASQMGENVLVEDTSLDVDGEDVGVNVKWLLNNLEQFVGKRATFTVMMGVLREGVVEVYRGSVQGTLVEPRGKGFGFDPAFLPDGARHTLGESKPDRYNARALAVKNFLKGRAYRTLPPLKNWEGPWQGKVANLTHSRHREFRSGTRRASQGRTAATVTVDPAHINALRKDVLMIARAADNVASLEDIDQVTQATHSWRKRWETFAYTLRQDLEARVRAANNPYDTKYNANPPIKEDAEYYLESALSPMWDFDIELGRNPRTDTTLKDAYGNPWQPPEKAFEATVQFYLDRGLSATREEAVREAQRYHDRRPLPTKAEAEAIAVSKWKAEAVKWTRRLRGKARKAWDTLNRYVDWLESWRGGKRPLEVIHPEEEVVPLAGFRVIFRGFAESPYKDELESVRVGLERYRKAITARAPLLLKMTPPIFIEWTSEPTTSGSAAAYYTPNRVSITPWVIGRDIDRFVKTMAHEVGHHLFHVYLSKDAKDAWAQFIRNDYRDLDLREALAVMDKVGAKSIIDESLMREDPILHIQLSTLMNDPGYSRVADWLFASGIRKYLDAGGNPIIRVPKNPITGYAGKNSDEAFCEALGNLVGYGPKAVPDAVLKMLRSVLGDGVRIASRVAAAWLTRTAHRTAAAPKKYNHIDFTPPKGVAEAAKKGLEYRQKASPSNKGGLTPAEAGKQGIGSGVQRAVNLKNRDTISPEVIKQMRGFLSRSEKSSTISPENKDTPWNDKGYVAWLLWGGDPAKAWVTKLIKQMEAADEKEEQVKKASRNRVSSVVRRFVSNRNVREHLSLRGMDSERVHLIVDDASGVATFLLYNLSGKMVGYQQYRPDAPKKMNGPEGRYWTYLAKSQTAVWGLDTLSPSAGRLFLTEGIFDAVKLHRQGEAAIALLGNGGSPSLRQWLGVLPQKVIAVLDRDDAGSLLKKSADEYITVPAPHKDLGDMTDAEVLAFLSEEGYAPKKPRVASANDLVSYKGKTYLLKWRGPTKYGERARLQFLDGSKDFWVDAGLVSDAGNSRTRTDVPRLRRDGTFLCDECGEYVRSGTPCWETGMRHTR